MFFLALIGFLGGLVTGISPCIIPVVPVIFAAGATSGLQNPDQRRGDETGSEPTSDQAAVSEVALLPATVGVGVGVASSGSASGSGSPPLDAALGDSVAEAMIEAERTGRSPGPQGRRPFAVVGGLVLSFSVFTLIGSSLLSVLGLPQDFLRTLGLVILGLVGLGLIVPPLGDLLERPFVRVARGRQHQSGNGFVLGLSLGLLFVPCAGPVLAAITVVSANHRIGLSAVILTVAFAVGVAVPLLAFAFLGQRLAANMRSLRTRAALLRKLVGVVLLVTALVIGLNVTDGLQRLLPGYTDALQTHLEGNSTAKHALGGVTGNQGGALSSCVDGDPVLQSCGKAPAFTGIQGWLNTPGDKPLSLAALRGKVVLVDFWTYSCINCQRTLPHLEAWNRAYAADGLTIVGVHTPEFDFEHVESNVVQAAKQLGVHYPIAIDNNYATWDAYQNEYWPAEYLIDASGEVRHVDFGEGGYGETESLIRKLLVQADPSVHLPPATDVANMTPTEQTTQESYLGYHYPQYLTGQTVVQDRSNDYVPPASVLANEHAYGGTWTVGGESSVAGPEATLQLQYTARDVYLVLGGTGTVTVDVNGQQTGTVSVSGIPRLYPLVQSSSSHSALLKLSVSPGVAAYDFTFG